MFRTSSRWQFKCVRAFRGSLCLLALFSAGRVTAAGESNGSTTSPLIVHEWGTFTSFAGSDGVNLEFRPLVDSDLPRFVYSPGSLTPFTKRTLFARQRMETPVTYFYSDVERDVKVSVAFRQGRLTEFYPPPVAHHSDSAVGESSVAQERIDWGQVHIIPERLLATRIANPDVSSRVNRHVAMGLVPWLDEANPYYRARETDSALLYVRRTPGQGQFSAASSDFRGDHFEKFLFYRGAGQIDVPLRAVATDSDNVHVENVTGQEVRGGVIVQFNGERLRFAPIGSVAAKGTRDTTLPEWSNIGQQESYAALDGQLTKLLVDEGLYEKEARSMVNTWRDSWYREVGLRVFFFLPQSQTDDVLPLTIEPQPDKVVRVMVARTELMTPAEEQKLVELLDRSAQNPAAQEELLKILAVRGRLAEPALRRCAALSNRQAAKADIERILPLLTALPR